MTEAIADTRASNLTVNHYDSGSWHVTTSEERPATSRITAGVTDGMLRIAFADTDSADDTDRLIARIEQDGINDSLAGGTIPAAFAGVEWRLNALTAWRAGNAEVWARKAGTWAQLLPGTSSTGISYVRVHGAEEIIVAGNGAHLTAGRAKDIAAWISTGLHETTEQHWDVTVVWARRDSAPRT